MLTLLAPAISLFGAKNTGACCSLTSATYILFSIVRMCMLLTKGDGVHARDWDENRGGVGWGGNNENLVLRKGRIIRPVWRHFQSLKTGLLKIGWIRTRPKSFDKKKLNYGFYKLVSKLNYSLINRSGHKQGLSSHDLPLARSCNPGGCWPP
jgi:hypothetical protein